MSSAGAEKMHAYLQAVLAGMEPTLARRVTQVLAEPNAPDSLKQLARVCGLSERHMRRALREAGVASSHRFFAARRVLRAWNDVAGGERLEVVATRYGFGTTRTLRAQWRSACGEWPSITAAYGVCLSDAMVERIAERVLGGVESVAV